MGYEIFNSRGEKVSSARNYTFAASLVSVLEKETGKKYKIETEKITRPLRKYKIALMVERPTTVTVKSEGLSYASDDLRPIMRSKYPDNLRYRIDWKRTKLLNILQEYDAEFLDEIGDD